MITKNHRVLSFDKAKGLLGHAYHGMRTFTQIYGAVAPLIYKHANNHADQIHFNVNQTIGGYGHMRNKVMEGDNDFQEVKRNGRS